MPFPAFVIFEGVSGLRRGDQVCAMRLAGGTISKFKCGCEGRGCRRAYVGNEGSPVGTGTDPCTLAAAVDSSLCSSNTIGLTSARGATSSDEILKSGADAVLAGLNTCTARAAAVLAVEGCVR